MTELDLIEQIRRSCVKTNALVQQLQPMKLQPSGSRHPDERRCPSPAGPRGPALGEAAIELELDLARDFHADLVSLSDISCTPPPPPPELVRCLDWVYTWAGEVVDPSVLFDVVECVRFKLVDFVAPEGRDPAQSWESASKVVHRLRRLGLWVTTSQLRTWRSRGHIASIKDEDGTRNLYQIGDVLSYLNRRFDLC